VYVFSAVLHYFPVGNLCTECQRPEWGRVARFDCERCPSPTTNRLRLFLSVLVLFLVVSGTTYVTLKSNKRSRTSIILKILLSYVQLNSLAASFDFEWPDPVRQLFVTFSTAPT